MDDDRSSKPTASTEPAAPSVANGVDETERDVITSGTAATSEVGDPAAQESARQRPGTAVDTTDAAREEGQDSGNSAGREDRESRG